MAGTGVFMSGFYECWLRWRSFRLSILSGRAYSRGDKLAGRARKMLDRAGLIRSAREAKPIDLPAKHGDVA